MQTENNTREWLEIETKEGLNGSGQKRWIVQGTRQGETLHNGLPRKIVVLQSFETEAEAQCWIKWAM